MFTPIIFEILVSEGRSVLSPAQRGTGSEMVNIYTFLINYSWKLQNVKSTTKFSWKIF